jgi:hypothetical protein
MQSLLRRTVNALRAERRVTPALRMLREGVDDVSPFMERLIEEPAPGSPGFVAFLDEVASEVYECLQEQGP